MPPPLSIDFCSAIDNALLLAARDEAMRRNAASAVAFRPGPSHGNTPAGRGRRPGTGVRRLSPPVGAPGPTVHAH